MRFKKHFAIFSFMAGLYLVLEVFSRAAQTALVGWNGIQPLSLAGWTTLWMLLIGGSTGFLIGLLNEKKKWHMSLIVLCGTFIIFGIEFTTGCLFNIVLNLHLWDYSRLPFNLLGQISIVYLPIWASMVPFASWLDDVLRFLFYGEEKPSKLIDYYLNIFRKNQK